MRRPQRTPRGRNCTLIRGPTAWDVFGTACSQVRWQLPPMTSRSPWPTSNRSEPPRPPGPRRATASRPQQQRPRRAQRHDRDDGVLMLAAPDGVAVPGDAVPAIPVQAQSSRAERLAELRSVVRVQRLPGGGEHRVGQRLVLTVEAEQPGNRHHLVVHVPFLRPPRNPLDQSPERRSRTRQPPGAHVDPGAVRQWRPPDRRPERAERGLVTQVKQRFLHRDAHAASLTRIQTHIRSRLPRDPPSRRPRPGRPAPRAATPPPRCRRSRHHLHVAAEADTTCTLPPKLSSYRAAATPSQLPGRRRPQEFCASRPGDGRLRWVSWLPSDPAAAW